MSDALLVDRPGPGVVLLTLNRPEVLNAIDMALARQLKQTLEALAGDDEARCIVMAGAGNRAFSAGFDIKEMEKFDVNGIMQSFLARDPITLLVATHPKPVIAALNGAVYGAGALLSLAADIRIGSPTMRFKVTATMYGAANATWTFPRVVGVAKAKEILMMGREVGGEEAAEIGLLNQLVPEQEVLSTAISMATRIAANPAHGVQGVKQLVDASTDRSIEDAYRAEFAWMVELTQRAAKGGADLFSGFVAGSRKKP